MSRKKYKYYFMASGLIAAMFAYFIFSLPDGKLHVFFLDVGQGDAALVRTPSGGFILIDGGPDDSVLREMGKFMPFYVRTLDLVVLTHPHPDHINGLIEALKRYEVMAVLITGINYKYAGYDEFLEILDEKDIKVFLADGRDFQLDGVMFDMIFPFGSIQGREFENINNSSIVFRLIYGESEFYFSGDAELPVEAQIVAKNIDVYADVLKVAHHGSRTASSDALVDLIHPAYAVISVGTDNSFKHPHKETIDVLTADNVKILRTDLTGTIEFVSDGKTLVGKNF